MIKFFAFHVESVDDVVIMDINNANSSSASYQLYYHGYVLCRLPSLMDAVRKLNIGDPEIIFRTCLAAVSSN